VKYELLFTKWPQQQHNYHEREGDLLTLGTISNKSTEALPQLKRGFNDNFVAMKICNIVNWA
jgi:hypothetical protein